VQTLPKSFSAAAYLRLDLLKIKCELLYRTSTRKEGNVGYIREETHIPNALKFWMEMWRLSILVVMSI